MYFGCDVSLVMWLGLGGGNCGYLRRRDARFTVSVVRMLHDAYGLVCYVRLSGGYKSRLESVVHNRVYM